MRGARLMSGKAAAVKALAADQKALADAVSALGAARHPKFHTDRPSPRCPLGLTRAECPTRAAGDSPAFAKVKAITEEPAHAETMAKVKAEDLSWTWSMLESSPSKPPVTVAVAAGGTPAGAAALYRIAAGEMLGPDQPVTINVLGADAATIKDIEAIGFPLLKGISSAASESAVMSGATYAILLGGDMAALGKAASKGTLVGAAGCANAAKAAKGSGAVVTAITSAPALATTVSLADAAGVSPSAVTNVRARRALPAATRCCAEAGGRTTPPSSTPVPGQSPRRPPTRTCIPPCPWLVC